MPEKLPQQAAAQKAAAAKKTAEINAHVAAQKAAVAQLKATQAAQAKAAAAAKAQADAAAATKAGQNAAAAKVAAAQKAAAAKAAAARAAKAAADKLAKDTATQLKAARQAQQKLDAQQAKIEASKYYASCADAEKAGAAPLKRGQPGYRKALDRNNDGVACEVLSDSQKHWDATHPSAPSSSSSVYYASCAEAELAGVTPIKKGQPGYRIGLDSNKNGIACEPSSSSSGSSSAEPVTTDSGAASSRNDAGHSNPGAWTAAKGRAAVAAAVAEVGVPYSWGGGNANGPTLGICGPDGAENDCNVVGFDCSGLTSYAWAQAGISIPAYSVYQYTLGQHISTGSLLPGDLLFYANDTSDPSTIHHVAMYIGNGQMVEAPYSGAYVQVTGADFGDGFIGATRPGT